MIRSTMKTRLILVGVALLTCASQAEQDIITKSLSAKPGDTLKMRVDRGEIEIHTHADEKVEVRVMRELKRASSSEAKKIFEEHAVEIQEVENGILIKAERANKGKGGGIFRRDPVNQLQVSYTITVPYEYNLDLRTSGGSIQVGQLGGDVDCRTSGGDVRIGSVKGRVEGRTSGGSVRVEAAGGPVEASTSGGDIRINASAGDVRARTSGGSITLREAAGAADLETSGGNIRVDGVTGPISAQTSGGSISAALVKAPSADCTLKTSGGNVELALPAESAVKLMARTSGGNVKSEFPGELNKQRDRYSAELNGGGPSVVLQTSGGNITVKKR